MGNGGAMRIGPVGAYFADDLDLLKSEVIKGTEVTHYNAEGICGALAIALAVSFVCRLNRKCLYNDDDDDGQLSEGNPLIDGKKMIQFVLKELPENLNQTETRKGIEKVLNFDENITLKDVVDAVGSGDTVLAQDTVPFAVCSSFILLKKKQQKQQEYRFSKLFIAILFYLVMVCLQVFGKF